jgi:AAA+ ATPase superfamily predicted ATPase
MFVGREREIRDWSERWDAAGPQLIVLYGRRRIGKTALAREFARGRNAVFYTGGPVREVDNLRGVAETMSLSGIRFESWDAALTALLARAAGERLLVVLDEYPAMAAASPDLGAVLQRWWDIHGCGSRLFVVLSGSSLGFMEREVLSHASPLFGRRTGSVRLQPLEPWEIAPFLPGASVADLLTAYGLFGGVPAYLERLLQSGGMLPFLRKEAFSPGGFLFEEVPFLVNTELREPATYLSILSALAGGSTRLTEVADRCLLPVTSVNRYVTTLIELGLARRSVPFFERAPDKARKGLYSASDPWVRFWCSFVLPARSVIEAGHGHRHMEERVLPGLAAWMGRAFEEACLRYVESRWGQEGGPYALRVGRQWQKERDATLTEVDLVAELSDGSYLVGECKSTGSRVGRDVLELLRRKAALLPIPPGRLVRPTVFSLFGFTRDLRSAAAHTGVVLVTGEEVFGR